MASRDHAHTHTAVKSGQPERPWETEGDAFDWTDEASGYPVRMRRGPMKSWCCYVGIPSDHAWFGKGYGDPVDAPEGFLERPIDIDQIGAINLFISGGRDHTEIAILARCHGGLTWAADHPGGNDGEKDGLWWFGFDCSHAGDYSPRLKLTAGEVYRDAAYVRQAATTLCADLLAARVGPRVAAQVVGDKSREDPQ